VLEYTDHNITTKASILNLKFYPLIGVPYYVETNLCPSKFTKEEKNQHASPNTILVELREWLQKITWLRRSVPEFYRSQIPWQLEDEFFEQKYTTDIHDLDVALNRIQFFNLQKISYRIIFRDEIKGEIV
jgi:hypothetical protein